MLDHFTTFLQRAPRSSPIRLPRWANYIDQLQSGVDRLIERNRRFTEDPIPSAGIDYINSMIVRADIPHLLKITNDVDLLRQVHREYQSPAYSDANRQSPLKSKFFVHSDSGTSPELVLLTDDFNLTDELPLGDEDIDSWYQSVRPLRMLELDSDEVQMDVVMSRFKFRYLPPNKAMFSLNVVKLLMLYIKYRQQAPEEFELTQSNFPFIYRTCITPMLYDNTRTYLISLISDLVDGLTIGEGYQLDERKIIHGGFSQFLVGSRTPALAEMSDLIIKCRTGKVKPDEVMNSLMVDKQVSILEYSDWLMESHYIGSGGRQFEWLLFLRDYRILTIMFKLYSFDRDSNRAKELTKLFNVMMSRIKNTRIWSHARPRSLNQYILERFEMLQMMYK